MANVKVAVRVRPPTKKELDAGAVSIIDVNEDVLSITNLKINSSEGDRHRERVKNYSFDHCYNSVDRQADNYASQELIYQDLGTEVLNASFSGYNACLFAYGQTGSGKTYTVMGDDVDAGLIPRICEGMCSRVDDLDQGITFKIEVSYLEIYNERVRDLLATSNDTNYTLKVREHPKDGPYVQDLTRHMVSDFNSVIMLIAQGNRNRTTAATHMHKASSRSHAIFTLNFVQAKMVNNMPSEIVSKINLVDLAGSERANLNYSKGRLQEGANINKSLVTLGNCISALGMDSEDDDAENSMALSAAASMESLALSEDTDITSPKRRPGFIPYRNSVLTWLLKDSLGGNSRTIMIATISPSSTYFNETMSTLRYARRAKRIINQPLINEDPNVRLIRELRAEINRLKTLLSSASLSSSQASLVQDVTLSKMLAENEQKVDQLTEAWVDKWREAARIMQECNVGIRRESMGVIVESELPHLIGMDDDLLSTGIIIYHLMEGKTTIGREDSETEQDIVLWGPGIDCRHAVIVNHLGRVALHPVGQSLCAVNGNDIHEPTPLSQGAVVLLGKTNMFRFNHPTEAARLREKRASSIKPTDVEEIRRPRKNSVTLRVHNNLTAITEEGTRLRKISLSRENPPTSRDSPSLSRGRSLDNSSSPVSEVSSIMMYNPGVELERQHKIKVDKVENTRKRLEELQDKERCTEAAHKEEKERMKIAYEEHQRMIQEQRDLLQRLREEHENEKQETAKELQEMRERLAREKEQGQKQLEEECHSLRRDQTRKASDSATESTAFPPVDAKETDQSSDLSVLDVDRKRLTQLELIHRQSQLKAEAALERTQAAFDRQRCASMRLIEQEERRLHEIECIPSLSDRLASASNDSLDSSLRSEDETSNGIGCWNSKDDATRAVIGWGRVSPIGGRSDTDSASSKAASNSSDKEENGTFPKTVQTVTPSRSVNVANSRESLPHRTTKSTPSKSQCPSSTLNKPQAVTSPVKPKPTPNSVFSRLYRQQAPKFKYLHSKVHESYVEGHSPRQRTDQGPSKSEKRQRSLTDGAVDIIARRDRSSGNLTHSKPQRGENKTPLTLSQSRDSLNAKSKLRTKSVSPEKWTKSKNSVSPSAKTKQEAKMNDSTLLPSSRNRNTSPFKPQTPQRSNHNFPNKCSQTSTKPETKLKATGEQKSPVRPRRTKAPSSESAIEKSKKRKPDERPKLGVTTDQKHSAATKAKTSPKTKDSERVNMARIIKPIAKAIEKLKPKRTAHSESFFVTLSENSEAVSGDGDKISDPIPLDDTLNVVQEEEQISLERQPAIGCSESMEDIDTSGQPNQTPPTYTMPNSTGSIDSGAIIDDSFSKEVEILSDSNKSYPDSLEDLEELHVEPCYGYHPDSLDDEGTHLDDEASHQNGDLLPRRRKSGISMEMKDFCSKTQSEDGELRAGGEPLLVSEDSLKGTTPEPTKAFYPEFLFGENRSTVSPHHDEQTLSGYVSDHSNENYLEFEAGGRVSDPLDEEYSHLPQSDPKEIPFRTLDDSLLQSTESLQDAAAVNEENYVKEIKSGPDEKTTPKFRKVSMEMAVVDSGVSTDNNSVTSDHTVNDTDATATNSKTSDVEHDLDIWLRRGDDNEILTPVDFSNDHRVVDGNTVKEIPQTTPVCDGSDGRKSRQKQFQEITTTLPGAYFLKEKIPKEYESMSAFTKVCTMAEDDDAESSKHQRGTVDPQTVQIQDDFVCAVTIEMPPLCTEKLESTATRAEHKNAYLSVFETEKISEILLSESNSGDSNPKDNFTEKFLPECAIDELRKLSPLGTSQEVLSPGDREISTSPFVASDETKSQNSQGSQRKSVTTKKKSGKKLKKRRTPKKLKSDKLLTNHEGKPLLLDGRSENTSSSLPYFPLRGSQDDTDETRSQSSPFSSSLSSSSASTFSSELPRSDSLHSRSPDDEVALISDGVTDPPDLSDKPATPTDLIVKPLPSPKTLVESVFWASSSNASNSSDEILVDGGEALVEPLEILERELGQSSDLSVYDYYEPADEQMTESGDLTIMADGELDDTVENENDCNRKTHYTEEGVTDNLKPDSQIHSDSDVISTFPVTKTPVKFVSKLHIEPFQTTLFGLQSGDDPLEYVPPYDATGKSEELALVHNVVLEQPNKASSVSTSTEVLPDQRIVKQAKSVLLDCSRPTKYSGNFNANEDHRSDKEICETGAITSSTKKTGSVVDDESMLEAGFVELHQPLLVAKELLPESLIMDEFIQAFSDLPDEKTLNLSGNAELSCNITQLKPKMVITTQPNVICLLRTLPDDMQRSNQEQSVLPCATLAKAYERDTEDLSEEDISTDSELKQVDDLKTLSLTTNDTLQGMASGFIPENENVQDLDHPHKSAVTKIQSCTTVNNAASNSAEVTAIVPNSNAIELREDMVPDGATVEAKADESQNVILKRGRLVTEVNPLLIQEELMRLRILLNSVVVDSFALETEELYKKSEVKTNLDALKAQEISEGQESQAEGYPSSEDSSSEELSIIEQLRGLSEKLGSSLSGEDTPAIIERARSLSNQLEHAHSSVYSPSLVEDLRGLSEQLDASKFLIIEKWEEGAHSVGDDKNQEDNEKYVLFQSAQDLTLYQTAFEVSQENIHPTPLGNLSLSTAPMQSTTCARESDAEIEITSSVASPLMCCGLSSFSQSSFDQSEYTEEDMPVFCDDESETRNSTPDHTQENCFDYELSDGQNSPIFYDGAMDTAERVMSEMSSFRLQLDMLSGSDTVDDDENDDDSSEGSYEGSSEDPGKATESGDNKNHDIPCKTRPSLTSRSSLECMLPTISEECLSSSDVDEPKCQPVSASPPENLDQKTFRICHQEDVTNLALDDKDGLDNPTSSLHTEVSVPCAMKDGTTFIPSIADVNSNQQINHQNEPASPTKFLKAVIKNSTEEKQNEAESLETFSLEGHFAQSQLCAPEYSVVADGLQPFLGKELVATKAKLNMLVRILGGNWESLGETSSDGSGTSSPIQAESSTTTRRKMPFTDVEADNGSTNGRLNTCHYEEHPQVYTYDESTQTEGDLTNLTRPVQDEMPTLTNEELGYSLAGDAPQKSLSGVPVINASTQTTLSQKVASQTVPQQSTSTTLLPVLRLESCSYLPQSHYQQSSDEDDDDGLTVSHLSSISQPIFNESDHINLLSLPNYALNSNFLETKLLPLKNLESASVTKGKGQDLGDKVEHENEMGNEGDGKMEGIVLNAECLLPPLTFLPEPVLTKTAVVFKQEVINFPSSQHHDHGYGEPAEDENPYSTEGARDENSLHQNGSIDLPKEVANPLKYGKTSNQEYSDNKVKLENVDEAPLFDDHPKEQNLKISAVDKALLTCPSLDVKPSKNVSVSNHNNTEQEHPTSKNNANMNDISEESVLRPVNKVVFKSAVMPTEKLANLSGLERNLEKQLSKSSDGSRDAVHMIPGNTSGRDESVEQEHKDSQNLRSRSPVEELPLKADTKLEMFDGTSKLEIPEINLLGPIEEPLVKEAVTLSDEPFTWPLIRENPKREYNGSCDPSDTNSLFQPIREESNSAHSTGSNQNPLDDNLLTPDESAKAPEHGQQLQVLVEHSGGDTNLNDLQQLSTVMGLSPQRSYSTDEELIQIFSKGVAHFRSLKQDTVKPMLVAVGTNTSPTKIAFDQHAGRVDAAVMTDTQIEQAHAYTSMSPDIEQEPCLNKTAEIIPDKVPPHSQLTAAQLISRIVDNKPKKLTQQLCTSSIDKAVNAQYNPSDHQTDILSQGDIGHDSVLDHFDMQQQVTSLVTDDPTSSQSVKNDEARALESSTAVQSLVCQDSENRSPPIIEEFPTPKETHVLQDSKINRIASPLKSHLVSTPVLHQSERSVLRLPRHDNDAEFDDEEQRLLNELRKRTLASQQAAKRAMACALRLRQKNLGENPQEENKELEIPTHLQLSKTESQKNVEDDLAKSQDEETNRPDSGLIDLVVSEQLESHMIDDKERVSVPETLHLVTEIANQECICNGQPLEEFTHRISMLIQSGDKDQTSVSSKMTSFASITLKKPSSLPNLEDNVADSNDNVGLAVCSLPLHSVDLDAAGTKLEQEEKQSDPSGDSYQQILRPMRVQDDDQVSESKPVNKSHQSKPLMIFVTENIQREAVYNLESTALASKLARLHTLGSSTQPIEPQSRLDRENNQTDTRNVLTHQHDTDILSPVLPCTGPSSFVVAPKSPSQETIAAHVSSRLFDRNLLKKVDADIVELLFPSELVHEKVQCGSTSEDIGETLAKLKDCVQVKNKFEESMTEIEEEQDPNNQMVISLDENSDGAVDTSAKAKQDNYMKRENNKNQRLFLATSSGVTFDLDNEDDEDLQALKKTNQNIDRVIEETSSFESDFQDDIEPELAGLLDDETDIFIPPGSSAEVMASAVSSLRQPPQKTSSAPTDFIPSKFEVLDKSKEDPEEEEEEDISSLCLRGILISPDKLEWLLADSESDRSSTISCPKEKYDSPTSPSDSLINTSDIGIPLSVDEGSQSTRENLIEHDDKNPLPGKLLNDIKSEDKTKNNQDKPETSSIDDELYMRSQPDLPKTDNQNQYNPLQVFENEAPVTRQGRYLTENNTIFASTKEDSMPKSHTWPLKKSETEQLQELQEEIQHLKNRTGGSWEESVDVQAYPLISHQEHVKELIYTKEGISNESKEVPDFCDNSLTQSSGVFSASTRDTELSWLRGRRLSSVQYGSTGSETEEADLRSIHQEYQNILEDSQESDIQPPLSTRTTPTNVFTQTDEESLSSSCNVHDENIEMDPETLWGTTRLDASWSHRESSTGVSTKLDPRRDIAVELLEASLMHGIGETDAFLKFLDCDLPLEEWKSPEMLMRHRRSRSLGAPSFPDVEATRHDPSPSKHKPRQVTNVTSQPISLTSEPGIQDISRTSPPELPADGPTSPSPSPNSLPSERRKFLQQLRSSIVSATSTRRPERAKIDALLQDSWMGKEPSRAAGSDHKPHCKEVPNPNNDDIEALLEESRHMREKSRAEIAKAEQNLNHQRPSARPDKDRRNTFSAAQRLSSPRERSRGQFPPTYYGSAAGNYAASLGARPKSVDALLRGTQRVRTQGGLENDADCYRASPDIMIRQRRPHSSHGSTDMFNYKDAIDREIQCLRAASAAMSSKPPVVPSRRAQPHAHAHTQPSPPPLQRYLPSSDMGTLHHHTPRDQYFGGDTARQSRGATSSYTRQQHPLVIPIIALHPPSPEEIDPSSIPLIAHANEVLQASYRSPRSLHSQVHDRISPSASLPSRASSDSSTSPAKRGEATVASNISRSQGSFMGSEKVQDWTSQNAYIPSKALSSDSLPPSPKRRERTDAYDDLRSQASLRSSGIPFSQIIDRTSQSTSSPPKTSSSYSSLPSLQRRGRADSPDVPMSRRNRSRRNSQERTTQELPPIIETPLASSDTLYHLAADQAMAYLIRETTLTGNVDPNRTQLLDQINGWRYLGEEKDILLWQKTHRYCSIDSFLGLSILRAPAHTVFNLINNSASYNCLPESIKSVKVLHKIDNTLKVIHILCDMDQCSLHQPRDFCCVLRQKQQHGRWYVVATSVKHPLCPTVSSAVRGQILCCGLSMEPVSTNDGEHCRVSYVSQIDLQGDLKPTLVNHLTSRHPLCLAHLRDCIEIGQL